MTRKRSHQAWKKWHTLICEQVESGQTISAYCRQRGVNRQSFFAWKKRLSQDEAKGFVEVKVAKAITNPAEPVRGSAAIEVRLQNGRSLVVGPGFDTHHLRTLVAVLESEA
jgi:hypothetical protein